MNDSVPASSKDPSSPRSHPKIGLKIPCYEDPGEKGPGQIEIDQDQLTRHILVTGTTGAGKSTLLRSIIRQLLAANADNEAAKAGLVIFDFKGDNTVEVVKRAAIAAGRADDVRVLSLDSDCGYDFFRGCQSLADVSEYANRLVFGCGSMDRRDDFWTQFRLVLLSAALTWLRINHGERTSFPEWITHAASWLLCDGVPAELKPDLAQLSERCDAMPHGSPGRIATKHAIQVIESWDSGMDFRTRANAKATLDIALGPLLEPSVLRLFRAAPEQIFDVRAAVESGEILIVSINAFLHPELASLVSRCVKADFYRAVFSRKPGGRFVSLICDEFQLCATTGNPRYDDSHALPLLRSQNAGVIAATQTVAGIDRVIGEVNRRVLLGNFGTLFFMRSTEIEIEAWARQVCGSTAVEETIREEVRRETPSRFFPEVEKRLVTRREQRPVCGPGALARLEAGQAFLLQEGRPPIAGPVWIAEPSS